MGGHQATDNAQRDGCWACGCGCGRVSSEFTFCAPQKSTWSEIGGSSVKRMEQIVNPRRPIFDVTHFEREGQPSFHLHFIRATVHPTTVAVHFVALHGYGKIFLTR